MKDKLQLMWHNNPPVTQGNQVVVGISIDGTKLSQRSFEHFAVGELGSRLPLGSWVLLHGSETTQILRDFAHQENLNLDVFAVNEMQVLNEGGFATPVVCVIIANTKAQVALSGCRNFKCKGTCVQALRGELFSLFGCVWAGNLNFAQGLAMGGMTLLALLPSKDHRTLDSMACTVWCIVRAVGWLRL